MMGKKKESQQKYKTQQKQDSRNTFKKKKTFNEVVKQVWKKFKTIYSFLFPIMIYDTTPIIYCIVQIQFNIDI